MTKSPLIFFAGLIALLNAAVASCAAPAPPNILFILTDDQGWATLSCQGNKLVSTPHLDGLARDGIRLTDAYVMPQCTPTRAALLSGQHTARNGMWHVIPWYGTPWARMTEPAFREQFPREAFNLPKGLRSAGYATGIAGKWHLTTGADGDYVALKPESGAAYGFDFVAPRGPGSQNEGDKQVDYLTGQAMQFIEQHRAQPWFFYLAHHTIHGKVSAPEPLVAKHLAQGAPAVGMGNATYRAAIEHMDNSVGRLLVKLDELKLRANTLVVFLSDNGGVRQMFDASDFRGEGTGRVTKLRVSEEQFDNAPLRDGKGGAYEGGIRVPCIVRWPGHVPPGKVEHTPVHVVDWLPTLLAAAGTAAPAGHSADGVNLLPLLRGGTLAPRALYWHMPLYDLRWAATPCAVIREGDWKLIESFGDFFDRDAAYHVGARLELFNLRADLGEQRNLASSDPARAARMRGQLRAWLKSIPAEVPSANPRHDATRELQETSKRPNP
ncbi:MAG: sulfatase [Verrucomicrobia bacterium]|nr:sulfatase [Verrucomicrobiota bacterium]